MYKRLQRSHEACAHNAREGEQSNASGSEQKVTSVAPTARMRLQRSHAPYRRRVTVKKACLVREQHDHLELARTPHAEMCNYYLHTGKQLLY